MTMDNNLSDIFNLYVYFIALSGKLSFFSIGFFHVITYEMANTHTQFWMNVSVCVCAFV